MNIEEAKDELYRLRSDIRTGYPLRTNQQKERYMEAIDMAVKLIETDNIIKEQIRLLGKMEGKVELIEKVMKKFRKNQKVIKYLTCELKNLYFEKWLKFGEVYRKEIEE